MYQHCGFICNFVIEIVNFVLKIRCATAALSDLYQGELYIKTKILQWFFHRKRRFFNDSAKILRRFFNDSSIENEDSAIIEWKTRYLKVLKKVGGKMEFSIGDPGEFALASNYCESQYKSHTCCARPFQHNVINVRSCVCKQWAAWQCRSVLSKREDSSIENDDSSMILQWEKKTLLLKNDDFAARLGAHAWSGAWYGVGS